VTNYSLLDIITRTWDRVAGDDVAAATLVTDFTDGVLTVMVPNAAWVHLLTPQAAELCDKLNHALLEPGLVRAIHFGHGVPYVTPV
jgi:predicted nucleic acid-binding Zn ribbon protein